MTVPDMRPFVRQYRIAAFLQIVFRNRNALHPAERCHFLCIVYKERHSIFQTFLARSTEQAKHSSQRPQMSAQEEQDTQEIDQQQERSPRERSRNLFHHRSRFCHQKHIFQRYKRLVHFRCFLSGYLDQGH